MIGKLKQNIKKPDGSFLSSLLLDNSESSRHHTSQKGFKSTRNTIGGYLNS